MDDTFYDWMDDFWRTVDPAEDFNDDLDDGPIGPGPIHGYWSRRHGGLRRDGSVVMRNSEKPDRDKTLEELTTDLLGDFADIHAASEAKKEAEKGAMRYIVVWYDGHHLIADTRGESDYPFAEGYSEVVAKGRGTRINAMELAAKLNKADAS